MNKSQSLALVAIGVIAVLLVTAAVADPQDAMAGKKHKKHHHNNGGAAAAAPQETLQPQQQQVAAVQQQPHQQVVQPQQQQQAIRIEAITDRTSQNISFFSLFLEVDTSVVNCT